MLRCRVLTVQPNAEACRPIQVVGDLRREKQYGIPLGTVGLLGVSMDKRAVCGVAGSVMWCNKPARRVCRAGVQLQGRIPRAALLRPTVKRPVRLVGNRDVVSYYHGATGVNLTVPNRARFVARGAVARFALRAAAVLVTSYRYPRRGPYEQCQAIGCTIQIHTRNSGRSQAHRLS